MKSSKLAFWTSLFMALALIALATGVVYAQAPGGGGGGGGQRGGMQNLMYMDRAWTAVSFGVEATTDQLDKLRPTFQTAFQSRLDLIKGVMEAQDRQAAMQDAITKAQQMKDEIDAKLKEVLTPDQMTKLQPMLSFGQGGGRGGGGGAGAGGAGGAGGVPPAAAH